MFTHQDLIDTINNINKDLITESDSKSNSKSFPNPFSYSMTSTEKILYCFIKKSFLNEEYANASLGFNFIPNVETKKMMINRMFIDFCADGNTKAFNYALENGADINSNNNSSFIAACKNGNLNLVLSLMDAGVTPNLVPKALIEAALNQQKEIITELIKIELNINANNTEVLRICAAKGLVDMVDFLIQNGASVHALNDRSLVTATMNGHIDTVRVLLHHGANPNTWNGYCFKIAKEKHYDEIHQMLQDKKNELDDLDDLDKN